MHDRNGVKTEEPGRNTPLSYSINGKENVD